MRLHSGARIATRRRASGKPRARASAHPRRPATQELAGADAGDEGRVPRTLEVELREDLVDCCAAGDVVTVVGLVRVLEASADAGARRRTVARP